MSEAWKSGSTRDWRKARARCLADNLIVTGGRCTSGVSERCSGWAEQAHHVLGISRDPYHTRLQAVCAQCNYKIGDPTKVDRVAPQPKSYNRW